MTAARRNPGGFVFDGCSIAVRWMDLRAVRPRCGVKEIWNHVKNFTNFSCGAVSQLINNALNFAVEMTIFGSWFF